MCPADLPHADALRQIAGWNQRPSDWQRFLDLSPRGCFVAATAGQIIGTVTTIQYDRKVAWIGMLLVHPDSRGHGLGKALLTRAIEYLQSQNIPSIKLDATPLGEPLYRKLGFKEEWKLTRFKGSNPRNPEIPATPPLDLNPENLQQVIALDSIAFGVARPELLTSLGAAAKLVTAHHGKRALYGFGVLRSGSSADYLGPVVGANKRAGWAVIVEILEQASRTSDRDWYWDVPQSNEAAMALAEKRGLRPERELLRMYLGRNDHPGDVSKYFAIADPSLG